MALMAPSAFRHQPIVALESNACDANLLLAPVMCAVWRYTQAVLYASFYLTRARIAPILAQVRPMSRNEHSLSVL